MPRCAGSSSVSISLLSAAGSTGTAAAAVPAGVGSAGAGVDAAGAAGVAGVDTAAGAGAGAGVDAAGAGTVAGATGAGVATAGAGGGCGRRFRCRCLGRSGENSPSCRYGKQKREQAEQVDRLVRNANSWQLSYVYQPNGKSLLVSTCGLFLNKSRKRKDLDHECEHLS